MEIKALKEKVDNALMELINDRKNSVRFGRSDSHGGDMLGMLLDEMQKQRLKQSNQNVNDLNLKMIMDELKTFFFAGHDTTALLLTWTVMLLATNTPWQQKVREEVTEVCGQDAPSSEHISKLNVVSINFFSASFVELDHSLEVFHEP